MRWSVRIIWSSRWAGLHPWQSGGANMKNNTEDQSDYENWNGPKCKIRLHTFDPSERNGLADTNMRIWLKMIHLTHFQLNTDATDGWVRRSVERRGGLRAISGARLVSSSTRPAVRGIYGLVWAWSLNIFPSVASLRGQFECEIK